MNTSAEWQPQSKPLPLFLSPTGDATSRLHCPHKELDDITRHLMTQLNRQLAERQNADSQQSMYLDLNITTSDGIETISLIFADAERRTSWEETFGEIKQKLSESFLFLAAYCKITCHLISKWESHKLVSEL